MRGTLETPRHRSPSHLRRPSATTAPHPTSLFRSCIYSTPSQNLELHSNLAAASATVTELRKQVEFLQKEYEKYRVASTNERTEVEGRDGYRSFQRARQGKGGPVAAKEEGVGGAGEVGGEEEKKQGKRARLRKWVAKAAFWR